MKSDKKIAVITGSAGGLGKEFAQRLLRSGNLQLNDLLFYLGYLIQLRLPDKYICYKDVMSFFFKKGGKKYTNVHTYYIL